MKSKILILLMLLASAQLSLAKTEKVTIDGAVGKLQGIVTTPDGLKAGQRVSTVIIFHGFSGNKNEAVHLALVDSLSARGIATVRFDFNGHGESEGAFVNMSIDNELEDARRIYAFTAAQPFAGKIGIVGHSQGGVISVLLSGELGRKKVKAVGLMAPAIVLHDNMIQGSFFGAFFDPVNVPEQVTLIGGAVTVGRDYILAAQRIQPFEAARRYKGPVLSIHGTADSAVPYSYSQYLAYFYKHYTLRLLPGVDHVYSGHEGVPAGEIARWMKAKL